MDQLIRREVRSSLSLVRPTARSSCRVRAAHDSQDHVRIAWYGVQCVSWVAHYDALRRAAGVVFTPEQTRQLDLWAAVARVVRLVVAP